MTSNNICKIGEFSDMVFYDAICACHSDNHKQTLILEVDTETNDVSLKISSKILTNQFTDWFTRESYHEALKNANYYKIAFFKAKLIYETIKIKTKFTFNLWFNGYVEAENDFMFRNEKAIDDYVDAIIESANKLKGTKSNG